MCVLKVEGVDKFFGKNHVLKDISLELKSTEIVTILGQSGCGKSTLLRIIAGLDEPSKGKIITKDKISLMFQNYALMPHLNVFDNIKLAMPKMAKNELKKEIYKLLDDFFITSIADSKIDEISGGQAQRVAFARAVGANAKILLLDEPFSNLDTQLKTALRSELKKLIKNSKMSAILVTHDKEDAFVMSDKIALVDEGQIIAFDEPRELFRYPKNAKIASFLGEINTCNNNNIKNQNFLKEMKKRGFMFRPNEIKRGEKYCANVINSEYFGTFQRFELEFEGFEFSAVIYDECQSSDEFWFDFKEFECKLA